MSNRVSPAPASSPLPPVDSPIPDESSFGPPPPAPPLPKSPPPLSEGSIEDRGYTPIHDNSNLETEDIEQAVYHSPSDSHKDDDDRNKSAPRKTSSDLSDGVVEVVEDPNSRDINGVIYDDEDDADDTVPQSSTHPVPTTSPSHAIATENVEGAEVEEGGQVRYRKPVVCRLPPLEDGIGDDATNERAGVSTKGVDANWDHYSYPTKQQQQHQQDFNSDFNQPHQQQQHFIMSARPNSGISRKDQEDETVIGANNSAAESGCCAIILTALSYILVVLFLPFSLCVTIKVVQEYERAVIFRLGRLLPGGAKGPGIFFVMPCIEEYTKVDLRTVSFDVPPQEVLTRDSVTVSVDAVVYYRISNPTVSVANVENAANSTQLLAQTTLRNVLGTQNLAEILSNRDHISQQMQIVLDGATDKWGIKVERVEIKDVRLPTQLQRAMATEAEAARDARAKVIAAEGEQKASVALKEAAEIIADTPSAMQLRYLQTLNSISAEKNSTIIFPIPLELVGPLMRNDIEMSEAQNENDTNTNGRKENVRRLSIDSVENKRKTVWESSRHEDGRKKKKSVAFSSSSLH